MCEESLFYANFNCDMEAKEAKSKIQFLLQP